eukprot:Sspe_Gene.119767::Locus_116597_Transcript_1_1_Confidence_1.000_Length_514::g.119767::m.119767
MSRVDVPEAIRRVSVVDVPRHSIVEFPVKEAITAQSRYRHGLLMCHEDIATTLMHLFCYPIAVGRTAAEFDETNVTFNCLFALCAPWFMATMMRHQIRIGYGIHGSWPVDLAIGVCCTCCSSCQLSREVADRGSVLVPPIVSTML